MKIIMNIESDNPTDCILGMKAVKALISDGVVSMGIAFENNSKAYAKKTKSGYSVFVSRNND